MSNYAEINRDLWDGWTKIHAESGFYDLKGFKDGKSTLKSVEIEELGDVSGKSMLHLQCHFGLDTLSWAQRGVHVTGVDFSEKAISLARSLSNELNIPAEFICSDIFELPKVLDRRFDIVFTSYGILAWLYDLNRWAKVVANYLEPGGTFYIVEFHPFLNVLCDKGETIEDSYFHNDKPMKCNEQGSYAEPDADFSHTCYVWGHGLGDVITSLISVGLKLEFVHEFAYSAYNFLPFFEESEQGCYVLKGRPNTIPLMFSIRANS